MAHGAGAGRQAGYGPKATTRRRSFRTGHRRCADGGTFRSRGREDEPDPDPRDSSSRGRATRMNSASRLGSAPGVFLDRYLEDARHSSGRTRRAHRAHREAREPDRRRSRSASLRTSPSFSRRPSAPRTVSGHWSARTGTCTVSERKSAQDPSGGRGWASASTCLPSCVNNGIIAQGGHDGRQRTESLAVLRGRKPERVRRNWVESRASFKRSQEYTVDGQNTALWLRLVERVQRTLGVQAEYTPRNSARQPQDAGVHSHANQGRGSKLHKLHWQKREWLWCSSGRFPELVCVARPGGWVTPRSSE